MVVSTPFYVIRTPRWIAPLYVNGERETTRNPKAALILVSEQAAQSFARRFARKNNLDVIVVPAGFSVCGPVLSLD